MDCGDVTEPSLATVGALARMQLNAKRSGCTIEIENAGPALLELLDLAGLAALLLKGQGKAEQREQARRVEEERELGDPPVL